jgi:SGNH domain (fused to AT3 domains)
MTMQGFAQRFPSQAQEFANAKFDSAFLNELTIDDIRAGKLIPIGATDSTFSHTVLVWGDSHAMAALPAVDAFLKERGLAGQAATHSATAPVLNWYQINRFGLGKGSIAYNDAVFSYIKRRQVPEVILIARWEDNSENGGGSSDDFNSSLLVTVRQLVAIGSRPWILLEVPNHSFAVPKALSRTIYSRAYIESLCAKPTAWNELDKNDLKIVARIEAAGGRILDPKPRFLDSTGQHYIIQANGIALYRDKHHLTTKGAKLMLLPFFHDSLTLEKQSAR